MIVEVYINNIQHNYNVGSSLPYYRAITHIRETIQKKYKLKKESCNLWFTGITK